MKSERFSERQMILGFKTIVLGICLYIVELLLLPVFGVLQKMHVHGDGYYSKFWKYTGKQPYPTILMLTGIIVIMGIALFIKGYKERDVKSKPDKA